MSPTASGDVALHLFGRAVDPPVPLVMTVAAVVLAVLLAVVLTTVLSTRAVTTTPGRAAPRWLARLVDSRAWALGWRGVGLLALGALLVPLLWGPDVTANPALGTFHVLVVVGLVPLSLLAGPVVRAVSPARTVDRMLSSTLRSDPDRGLIDYPESWGCRPAVLGLLALAWYVDVSARATYLGALQVWLTVYAAAALVGAAAYGSTWLARADPFEVASSSIALLSPWARDDRGRLLLVAPWQHLATAPVRPGVRGVVAVLLGWAAHGELVAAAVFSSSLGRALSLGGLCLVAWVLLVLLAGDRAWSLLPVAVALLLASHVTYLLEQGRTTVVAMGDPLVRGDGWIDPAAGGFAYALGYRPELLATLQVALLLAGLVVALLSDRDRGPAQRRAWAVPLLTTAWTATGLGLLALR